MDSSYYKKYEPIFGAWHIVREIGSGSFGSVYEIQREDFGRTYKAALKAITIPQSQSEVKTVMSDGMDEKSASAYFCSFVEEMVDEFAIMSKLKGNSNIVSYENHTVVEHTNGIGWDILIQMELLTPLLDYIQEHPLEHEDVVRFGIDICRALELCKKHNIVHRDIKPENIFVSENGDFKLGDFGIARTVEKTTSGLSKKGTYNYMAPEVYKGEAYGTSVDVYSLGLVLYWLLNKNRGPFLPPFPQPLTHADKDAALVRRLKGEVFPLPCNASEKMAAVILKACGHHPRNRYANATQFREDLEAIAAGQPLRYASVEALQASAAQETDPVLDTSGPTVSIFDVSSDTSGPTTSLFEDAAVEDATVSDFGGNTAFIAEDTLKTEESLPKKKKRSWLLVLLLLLLLSVSAAGYVFTQTDLFKEDTPSNSSSVVQEDPPPAPKILSLSMQNFELLVGDEKTLKTNNAEGSVTWTSSNNSVASVKNGKVTAHGIGTATIIATAENGTAQCTVIVQERIIPVEKILLDKTAIELFIGDTASLSASVSPEDATNKLVTWSSNNTAIVAVDNNGKLTAKTAGKATISATSGSITATCAVTVAKKPVAVASVSLSQSSLSLEEGQSATLNATVLPVDADNKTVAWSSSNTTVATVSNGKIAAKNAGTAVITAACGDYSAQCTVTVTPPYISVSSVVLSSTSMNLNRGSTRSLSASVYPSNATDTTITWSSSNPSVASVDTYGNVIAEGDGSARIIASAGGQSASCTVVVTTKWSDWTTTKPSGVEYETKTQYRYRDGSKETTTSSNSSLSGWTNIGSSSSWGNWSDWSSSYVSETSSREVETRTEYSYGRLWSDRKASPIYFCYDLAVYYSKEAGGNGSYWEEWTDWSEQRGVSSGYGFVCEDRSHDHGYLLPGTTGYWVRYEAPNGGIYYYEDTRTVYRYREKETTYSYYRWTFNNSSWSSWSDTPLTSSESRQVETRTQYRYLITN